MVTQKNPAPRERVAWAFRLMTSRAPDAAEIAELAAYYRDEFTRFGTAPEDAEELLRVGDLPHPDGYDAAETAAYTMVASAIFNRAGSISVK